MARGARGETNGSSTGSAPAAASGSLAGTATEATRPALDTKGLSELRLVGFAGGSRYAVFDARRNGEDTAVVFDGKTDEAFLLDARPVREDTPPYDAAAEIGLATSAAPSRLETSADGRILLATTNTGFTALDLDARGKVVAALDGDYDGAAIAPDGGAFAVWNEKALVVVGLGASDSGATASYPRTPRSVGAGPELAWTSRTLSWVDPSGAHVVHRATRQVTNVSGDEATQITVAKSGDVFAVWHDAHRGSGSATSDAPGNVEIWRLGDEAPLARSSSTFVSELTLDDRGAHAAWVEYSGDYDASTYFHAVDVGRSAHLRFAAKGPKCSIANERLVAIENGELHADTECSPGCPSLEQQSHFIAYDLSTGRALRRWDGLLERPYNEHLARRMENAATAAERLGLTAATDDRTGNTTFPMIDAHGGIVFSAADALHLGDATTGAVKADFAESKGVSIDDVRVSPDGSVVIATHDDVVSIWDGATARRRWVSANAAH